MFDINSSVNLSNRSIDELARFASTPLVSFKKPKQNPQPTGRGRGKFKGKGNNFSGQSAHRGKGRGAKGLGRS